MTIRKVALLVALIGAAGRAEIVTFPSTPFLAINNARQIVGPDFVYSNGIFRGLAGRPYGINDIGEIVGLNGNDSFLFRSGVYSTIDVPGALETLAYGITNDGEIVGSYYDAMDKLHGYTDTNGVFSNIDVPGYPTGTRAFGINNLGQVVGNYPAGDGSAGFLYSNGSFSTIIVPGSFNTEPRGINNKGQIVGIYFDEQGRHGFLYDSGVFSTIDIPGGPLDVYAGGINDNGDIVGGYSNVNFFDGGNGFIDLVPEPASATLLAGGVVMLAFVARVRKKPFNLN